MQPYRAPSILFNRHLETIYPALFRRVEVRYQRERITTPDDDFLDLDWLEAGAEKIVILSHGLEGNSSRAYIKGMAKAFHQHGFDVVAWNYRGCGSEMNRQLRFYHSGATDDLDCVVQHVIKKKNPQSICLIGFSLGGNLTLKYLGEKGSSLPGAIKSGITFSVPLDLHASCLVLTQGENWIYSQRFLKSLKQKVLNKAKHKRELDTQGMEKLNTLIAFDDRFTAPLHGFSNALDYYTQCSSIHFVHRIQVPTLIVNALNDPFLDPSCYSSSSLRNNDRITFETPQRGGHVGFALFNQNGLYWSEQRALAFVSSP